MGTKVQSKTYFPGFHSMRDLNNNLCNGMWDLYRDDKTLENSQYSFLTKPVINGYEGHEKEQLRQTILKQESVFRHQLQELHRLYKMQRDLMNEHSRNELQNHPTVATPSKSNLFLSQFPSENSKESPLNFPFVGPSFGQVSTLGTDSIHPSFAFEKGKCMPRRRTFDLELPVDLYDEGIRKVDKIPDLADLNEPIQDEETSSSASLNNFKDKAFLQEELLMRDACKNSSSDFWFSPQGFSQNHFAGMAAGIHPNNKHIGRERNRKEHSTYNCKTGNTNGNHSSAVSNLVQVDQAKIESQRKKTLFGVDISVGSYQQLSNACQPPDSLLSNPLSNVIKSDSIFSLPWGKTPVISGENILALQDSSCLSSLDSSLGNPNSVRQYPEFLGGKMHLSGSIPSSNSLSECANLMIADTDNCEKGLPWLLAKPNSNAEQINGKGSLYQMNLDSLQIHSPHFFKKAETIRGPAQVLSKDSSSLICARDSESVKVKTNECQKVTKILGFPVVDGLRHHIDLNLALNEEEPPLATSFSQAVVKIAMTEIDLEVPVSLESQDADFQSCKSMEPPPKLPLDSLTDSQEEVAKVAAEAIMTISSLSYQSLEASASDSLLWFADVVSSVNVNEDLVKVKPYDEDCNIPEGMDEFEFMTLKLKDTKEEEDEQCYNYKPLVFENDSSGAPSKRPRRGQGKRGRQKKDFQKDILPSLVCLARREVTEDLQTFEEAFTCLGDPWQSSMTKRKATRNGRGKKRLVGPTPPAAPIGNAVSPALPPTVQASCREVALEEKSLSGWGKRTRRLPRQRCINSSSSHALALKC